MTWKVGRLVLAAATLLLGGEAYARSEVAQDDRAFLETAARRAQAELELGNLAIARGIDPQVKEYGRRMVDERTKARTELQQLAKRMKLTLPTEMGADDHAAFDQLSKVSRNDFDRAYLDLMTSRQHDAIMDFETEAGTGENKDVKHWAAKSAASLRALRALAQDDRTHL